MSDLIEKQEALTPDSSPDGRGEKEKSEGKKAKEATWRDEMVIDISGITYRDMKETYRTGWDGQMTIFDRVVKQLPAEWGSHRDTDFKRRYAKAIDAEIARLLKLEQPEAVDVQFDVWDMSMAEERALREGKQDAEIVAKYVVKAPKSWGALHDVDTWLDLPHPVWMAVVDALIAAMNEVSLN
jgi:hypothetical protein